MSFDELRYRLTAEEMQEAFEQISQRYFNRNFGRMSKSDLDILLFSFYIKHCKKQQLPISDHQIAVNLGITEAKVRSLKVNSQLLFPDEEYNWRDDFQAAIEKARYDDSDYKVSIPILDPNTRRSLEDYIDTKGWYNEYQLNPKLIKMRPDQFIDLCISLSADNGHQVNDLTDLERQLAIRLEGTAASERLKKDKFVETWKNFGPGAALKDLLHKAPAALFAAVLDTISLSSPLGIGVKVFTQNMASK